MTGPGNVRKTPYQGGPLDQALDANRVPDVRAQMGQLPFRTPASQALPGLQPQILPPSLYKLPHSQDFNVNDFAEVLPVGPGAFISPVGMQFTLPAQMVGWIGIFGIYIQAPTNLTVIQFSLTINGGPVPGYFNIQFPPGVANFVVQNFADLQVPVPSGGVIGVTIQNLTAAGPWVVGAKVQGWYHQLIEEQQYFPNWR